MATSFSDGSINVHTLSGIYSESSVSDMHRMEAFLEGKEYKESEYATALAEKQNQPVAEVGIESYPTDELFGDMFGLVGSNARKAKTGRRA